MISPNGRVGARANLDGIDVFEMDSGKLAAHIDVTLPNCQYGWDRYFSFNQDGSFIAVASRDAIQVWQVGGGLIYEEPLQPAEQHPAQIPAVLKFRSWLCRPMPVYWRSAV